jgi:polysaccharide export outer membrane protein
MKTETRVDLTNKELFNSPVFYLQQNDIVYVEQNRAKKNTSAINPTSITLILTSVTLIVTLITLLAR